MTESIATPGDAPATATTSEPPLLAAERVRKIYRTGAGEVWALRDVDLEVRAGEFVAVMGPSGSGKTTLLNCLSGLDDIDAGRVMFDGRSLHDLNDAERTRNRASSMGFVFQSFNLIPVLSAVENVEVPLLLAGVHRKEARRRATETLERVGLGHRTDHRPNELSGGEQQRVTIARALAGRPRVVWADEPTGALDSESAEEVMQLMGELHREGLTLMLVTHDPTVGALGATDDPNARRRDRDRRCDATARVTAVEHGAARPVRGVVHPVRGGAGALAADPTPLDPPRLRPSGRGAARDRRLAPRDGDHHRLARRRRHDQPLHPRRRLRPARPDRRARVGAAPGRPDDQRSGCGGSRRRPSTACSS